MINNIQIKSKHTNKIGDVVKVVRSKIYVNFVEMEKYCVPVSLESFEADFIVDKEDFEKIKEICEPKIMQVKTKKLDIKCLVFLYPKRRKQINLCMAQQ